MRDNGLVGRTAELRLLSNALAAVADGRGGAVIVRGEAGIGKTALLDEAVRLAPSGVLLCRGSADVMDAHRPFGVLQDALGTDMPTIASGRFAMAEAIVEEIQMRCASQPTVVVLDDLQWVDQPSLVVVQSLGRVNGQLPLLLVCSARPTTSRDDLEQLLARLEERGATSLELAPLAEDACLALATRALGATPDTELALALRGAGGNPFFVLELAKSSTRDPVSHRSPSLRMTLLRHLSFLSPSTREILSVASVLGAHFSVAELSLVTGRSVSDLMASLLEAANSGVFTDAGERLAFRHELIRDTLYDELSAAVRTGFHRQMAHQLADAGAGPTRIAEHLLRSGDLDNRATVALVKRIADEITPLAPLTAVSLLEKAIGASGTSSSNEMVAPLAVAQLDAGRALEAEQWCLQGLAGHPSPRHEFALRSALSRALLVQGRIGDARRVADELIESATLSPADRADALARAAMLPMLAGDLATSLAMARQAELEGRAAGNLAAVGRALYTTGLYAACRGDFTPAINALTEAQALGRAADRKPDPDGAPEAMLAIVLVAGERADDAATTIARVRAQALEAGMAQQLFMAQQAAAGLALLTGRFDDLLAELDSIDAIVEDTGIGWRQTVDPLRGFVALARGGPQQAVPFAVGVNPAVLFAPGGAEPARFLLELLSARSGPSAAIEMAWPVWETIDSHGLGCEVVTLGPDLAALLCAEGARDQARVVADRLDDLAQRNPTMNGIVGAARRVNGLIEGDPDVLSAAVDDYKRSPRRFQLARTTEDAALSFAGAGRRAEAEQAARDAVDAYNELGASWMAGRARAQLREAGIRMGVRGARKRPATGWASLTVTERNVAELVASGLSNPDIAERLVISRRTVESHVSHCMAKLGLSSRVEFAALPPG